MVIPVLEGRLDLTPHGLTANPSQGTKTLTRQLVGTVIICPSQANYSPGISQGGTLLS